jgi:hypothetical protein
MFIITGQVTLEVLAPAKWDLRWPFSQTFNLSNNQIFLANLSSNRLEPMESDRALSQPSFYAASVKEVFR